MPITKTTTTKKYVPRRRYRRRVPRSIPMRGSKVALPKRTTGNFATATEQFSLGATAGVVYDFTFNLTDAQRCNQIADAYQYYRITSVEMRFKPNYDTFQAQTTNLLPYLYFQYDKSGSLGNLTAPGFENIGTKAIRMDDKTIVRKWKPSVLTDATNAPSGGSTQFKVSPWMPVYVGNLKNDTVVHRGAIFYISKMSPGDVLGYDVDVIVNVQFRKPAIPVTSSSETPNPNPPRVVQGLVSGIDLSLNPVLQR